MPQPTFGQSAGIGILKFGNASQPNGQGTMAWLNLNDAKSWFAQMIGANMGFDQNTRQLGISQFVYRGRSAFISDDYKSWMFRLPFIYSESTELGGSGAPLGSQLAALMMAGDQWLTTDDATGIKVRYSQCYNRKQLTPFAPYIWSFDLEFLAIEPWFLDLTATTVSALALNSGTATTFNVTYAGSVWCDNAVWTLTIPNTNTAPISSFVLANTTASQTLTVNFPTALAASTAWTITIDTGASTVQDQTGAYYDFTGSMPFLFPPAGQVNAMSATLTPASGTAAGCTIGASYTNRWTL